MKINIILSPSQQVNNKCAIGDSEAVHCRLIALKIAEKLKAYDCNVWLVPEIEGTESEILNKVCNSSNYFVENNKADKSYHLDIHTDAGNYATGASGFYVSEAGKNFISEIHKQLIDLTPWKDGKVSERELYVLRHTLAVAGLIEIAFHDNIQSATWIHGNIDLIADTIVRGLVNATGITLKKTEITLDEALTILIKNEVITNKVYWLNACEVVKYQSELMINMAKKLKG